MKINILFIIKDHFGTLYDGRSNKSSPADIFIFYIIPFILASFSYYIRIVLKAEVYNISITFFGIFIALILNIQVAMFSIFQRKWRSSSDRRVNESIKGTLADRKKLLVELNVNLSYLILVCCVALFLSLLSFIKSFDDYFIPSTMIFIYGHFLLTLLMVVKRAHALFDKEYRDSPD
jgi:hypothetical protein